MIKLNITAYANGTVTSQSQQQIRAALEAKLGHGIRHPLFDKLIQEAVAKAAKAKAHHYLRLDQIHQAAKPATGGGPSFLRIYGNQLRPLRRSEP